MANDASIGAVMLDIDLKTDALENKLNSLSKQITNALDTKTTTNFDSGLLKINGTLAKIGKGLAGAFATKKLIDFGKQCLDLGSDLAEVQNVVEVSFPVMSKQVDEFAKSAAQSFGLSETMAKRYMGTFGSMSKAFGFAENEAYDMSKTLTGLVGDVASFYNLDQDVAYTKLKSVFTGETESLKDLGIVMTQTALDQYALSNGFGKTTAQMTEQEKVSLRLAFVTGQLTNASGDFARTSTGWANQMRILTLQMDSFKAAIGQGLINVLSPVLQSINKVIGRLVTLANTFKAFTELITGQRSSGQKTINSTLSDTASEAGNVASGMNSAAGAATKLAKATEGAGDAAEEAAKKALGLMGFDEINKIAEQATSASSGGSGSGGSGSGGGSGGADGGTTGEAVDFGQLAQGDTVIDKTDTKLQALIARFNELKALFTKGFEISFGDTSVLDSVRSNIESIGKSLKDIFTSKEVTDAAKNYADSIALNLGKVAGSVASIGATIADNLTGGVATFLENDKNKIKEKLVKLFEVKTEINNIIGDFTSAIASIFTVFRSEDAKNITADIISIFSNGFLGALTLADSFAADLIENITAPITRNKDKIKTALEKTIGPLATVIGTISDTWETAWNAVQKLYDEHISPLLDAVGDTFSDVIGILLDGYNDSVAPVLEKLSKKFKDVFTDAVQPAIEKVGTAAGKVFDALSAFWTNVLTPLITFISSHIMPIIADLIDKVGTKLLNAVSSVATGIGVFADVITGTINLVSSLITAIRNFPAKVSTTFSAIQEAAFTNARNAYNSLVNNTVIKTISGKVTDAWNNAKNQWTGFMKNSEDKVKTIKGAITDSWRNTKREWQDYMKENAEKIKTIKGKIGETWTQTKKEWQDYMKNNVDRIKTIKGKITESWTKARDQWTGFMKSSADRTKTIRGKVTDSWTTAKKQWNDNITKSVDRIKTIKGKVADSWATIKSKWDAIKSKTVYLSLSFSAAAADLRDWINDHVIAKINSKFAQVPILKNHQLKYLAQGGYVKANTPQLAVIGDNKQYGEIVAPENKLEAMALKAASLASGGNSEEVVTLLSEVVRLLSLLNVDMYMDGNKVTKIVIDRINQMTKTTGKCPIIV